MPSFSLVIEYLTGYAVATDAGSREQPEWPPHPARVFMAMAAAHFESDASENEKRDQRQALEWLAQLSPPDLVVPNHAVREVLAVYVPVNDQNGSEALVKRSRQPRTFPRVHVGDHPVRLIYRVDPAQFPQHIAALENLCRHVTRIGHSSSLVWMRIERSPTVQPTHQADDSGTGTRFRTPFKSMMQELDHLFGDERREIHRLAHAQLLQEISQIKSEIQKLKRKGDSFESLEQEKKALDARAKLEPPGPIRPSLSHTTSYIEVDSLPKKHLAPSQFDQHLIILTTHESAADETSIGFGLESTSKIVASLRKKIHDLFPDRIAPSVISGHEKDGSKLQGQPHMAIVPLAFVGRHWIDAERFADGHVLGLGILIPKSKRAECARALSGVLFNADGYTPARVDLDVHGIGRWRLNLQTTAPTRRTLDSKTYAQPSTSWASVTPLLLDRMPKSDRVKNPVGWREEVADIISHSCTNVGLPSPVCVRVEKTPFFVGSLRAMPGQGGFPRLRNDRFQVHVQLDFDQPVQGPLVLGAGRFQGYGLMRPWLEVGP
jgi:CRISPR-associated protein Csb2